MDIERYVRAILEAAKRLNVRRIVGLGGVYGELPFDKERMISCNISSARLRAEMGAGETLPMATEGQASVPIFAAGRAIRGLNMWVCMGSWPTNDSKSYYASLICIEN